MKDWSVATSPPGTRVFESCLNCPGNSIEVEQIGLRQREACGFQLPIKRIGDLIYIPHLLVHASLILDTSSLTVSSGYDPACTTIQQTSVQTLDKCFLGWATVGGEFFSYKRFVSIVRRYFHYWKSGVMIKVVYKRARKIGNSNGQSCQRCYPSGAPLSSESRPFVLVFM